MKLLKIKCIFYLAALIMLVCQTAQAQTNTSPKAKTLAPKSKTLIIETVAPYVIFEYSPPFEIIDLASGKLPSFSHPELAIQAYFSAIRSLNYEEYLNCWTKNSQAVMRDNDSKIKYDAAKWKAIWADVFVGKNIQISHWINYGTFVLMQYRISPSKNPETAETTVALTLEGGEWRLTQELRNDQFLTGCNSPNGRIKVPSDALLPRPTVR